MNLVEKAKRIPLEKEKAGRWRQPEVIDLALAWARGEVHHKQVKFALGLGKSNSMTYQILAFALREFVNRNTNSHYK